MILGGIIELALISALILGGAVLVWRHLHVKHRLRLFKSAAAAVEDPMQVVRRGRRVLLSNPACEALSLEGGQTLPDWILQQLETDDERAEIERLKRQIETGAHAETEISLPVVEGGQGYPEVVPHQCFSVYRQISGHSLDHAQHHDAQANGTGAAQ